VGRSLGKNHGSAVKVGRTHQHTPKSVVTLPRLYCSAKLSRLNCYAIHSPAGKFC
jgi:hypothetical protein